MPVDHYENFPVAPILLPQKLRQPVAAIYAFARSADDIADEGDASPAVRLAQLDSYRAELDAIEANRIPDGPIFRPLAQAIRCHALPIKPFRDLLDAFSQDVIKPRYADFDELLDYCRHSANPVGRLMLHLYRAVTKERIVQSDCICSSLQLINFWQDVAIDWKKPRVYLPQSDLVRFDVSEAQIGAGRVDDNWRALMRFQIDRARAMMLGGAPLGRSIPGRIGLELRTVVAGGLRILEKIEAVDFDVFSRRPVLRAYDWPLLSWRALFDTVPSYQHTSRQQASDSDPRG
ncbi:MAG: squalene synthase HpnC [Sterolibacteriaceae bacterium]|uniref:Squalene synthase HpnC n=1 Tax=Candidatus Methylophosphatis roskildensis TaxID=2899263 RepID=A0A9D7E3Y3_9PROT|nr:squalene synthase HpnC [Candidatus Methylophosphatis roskildensis]